MNVKIAFWGVSFAVPRLEGKKTRSDSSVYDVSDSKTQCKTSRKGFLTLHQTPMRLAPLPCRPVEHRLQFSSLRWGHTGLIQTCEGPQQLYAAKTRQLKASRRPQHAGRRQHRRTLRPTCCCK
jgi:hypothetical protein